LPNACYRGNPRAPSGSPQQERINLTGSGVDVGHPVLLQWMLVASVLALLGYLLVG
jgi:hypothetical protein